MLSCWWRSGSQFFGGIFQHDTKLRQQFRQLFVECHTLPPLYGNENIGSERSRVVVMHSQRSAPVGSCGSREAVTGHWRTR